MKKTIVWLKEDWKGYYKGSCLHVEKETKKHYYGIHASMAGSYYIKFEKTKCTKTDPQKKLKLTKLVLTNHQQKLITK
jgi:hypothetical protein